MLAGAKSRDGSRHGFGVAAFEDRYDLEVRLRSVEVGRELLEFLSKLPAHSVPPLDFDRCAGRRGAGEPGSSNQDDCQTMNQQTMNQHVASPMDLSASIRVAKF